MPLVLVEADEGEVRQSCAQPQDAGYDGNRPVCGPVYEIASIVVCPADVHILDEGKAGLQRVARDVMAGEELRQLGGPRKRDRMIQNGKQP